jgi:hypothetical protein
MTAHSKIVIDKFCELCQWAFDSWRIHRVLFDESPRSSKLYLSKNRMVLEQINYILLDYFILQVAKLHDPASQQGQQGQINLGIEYIFRFGGWQPDTKAELQTLKSKLDELYLKIRPARNKLVSHNDLETFLNQKALGEFPAEADTDYFKTLEQFVNVVSVNSGGGQWHFKTDVNVAVNRLAESLLR